MARSEKGLSLRRVGRALAWGVGAFLVLFLCTYLVLTLLARGKEREATEAWAQAGLPLEGYLESFPSRGETPEELAVDASVRRLGIALANSDDTPGKTEMQAWKTVSAAVSRYGQEELEKPGALAAPPPQEVAAFLREKAEVLQEIREKLQTTAPVWRMESSKGFAAPVPSLLGNIELTRLFVASSLAAHSGGDDALAQSDLVAVWRLTEGLEKRPELISQLIVLAMRKMAVTALRKLDGVDPAWEARFSAWAPYEGLLGSYRAEAAIMGHFATAIAPSEESGLPVWIGRVPGKPFMRLCVADTQLWLLKHVKDLQGSDPCAADASTAAACDLKEEQLPRWNVVARIAIPNLTGSWQRVKYYDIQVELTRRVLAAKQARAADGTWPATFPGSLGSRCPGQSWNYAVDSEGEMVLAYSAPLPDKKTIKSVYPHEFRQMTAAPARAAKNGFDPGVAGAQ